MIPRMWRYESNGATLGPLMLAAAASAEIAFVILDRVAIERSGWYALAVGLAVLIVGRLYLFMRRIEQRS